MSALKSWFPFRFSRHNKNNRKAADAVPAHVSGASNGGLTGAGMRQEMDRMLDRMWSTPLEDLEIEVQDGVLIVTGEKKQEATSDEEGCYRTERSYGFFRRAIPLPDEVDPNKAEAHLDKGVVTIKLPKSEAAKKQTLHIPVNS